MGYSWSYIGELTKDVAPVFTAAAAWFAAWTAWRGLNKWRAETIGKQKAELAEEVLAEFYKACDITHGARLPARFGDEGTTRQRSEWKTDDDTRNLNSYFVPIDRLTKWADFFGNLHARRYRFIARFGEDSTKLYDELDKIRKKVIEAATMLIYTYRQRELGGVREDRNKWLKTIGYQTVGEEDPIASQLDTLVGAVEALCRPVIQESTK
jgi:hypothetical protein